MSDNAKPDEPRSPDGASDAAAELRRRALSLPEGSLGIFLLLLIAAASGGVVAAYWPLLFGEHAVTDERVAALEARVGELATGNTSAAASGVFAELRRNLGVLSNRLDANEARLTALEKLSAAAPAAPGAPGSPATAPLHGAIDATAAAIAQLGDRLTRLERANSGAEQIPDLAANVAKLQARVAALDADIARFSETQKGTMDAVNGRLAKIEAALPPDLAQRLDLLAPKSDMGAVEARVAQLEVRNAGDTLHRAAAVLALANLANAAADGKPFTVQLDALAAAEPDDPGVSALRPWAAAGVPTTAMLRVRFPLAARAALDVAHRAVAADVFSRLWVNLQSLISVRRVGEVAGVDPESRLARAQVRVNANDIAGAIVEVAAVPPPSAAALAPWLRDARNRVALDRILAQLNARVVRAIAAAPAPQSTTPVQAAPAPPARPPVPVPAPARAQTPGRTP